MARPEITAQHITQADEIAAVHNRSISYGVDATNPLTAEHLAAREAIDHKAPQTSLGHPDLVKVTRLRLLSDAGFPWWDVSYCYGELRDGTPVRVHLGTDQLRKRGRGVDKGHLIELAKTAGKFAKGLGLLDDDVISTLS